MHFSLGYIFHGNAAIVLVAVFILVGCGADRVKNQRVAFVIPVSDTININTASVEELQRIPNVGESTARRIVEYREQYGPFSRTEDLMQIRGISDERFRQIRHLIRAE